MYNFDGDYRRRPMQNLGGVSLVNDRETLIRKAQLERQKRNELRKQNNGATIIQSYTRSYLIKQRIKLIERVNYDKFWFKNKDKMNMMKADSDLLMDNLSYLLKRLLFFYTKTNLDDRERLANICKIIIKNPGKIIENCTVESLWLYRIKKLLIICLEQLTVPNVVHTMPIRTLETFLSYYTIKKWSENDNEQINDDENLEINSKCIKYFKEIYKYLIKKDYFKKLRYIFEDKCPPLNDFDYDFMLPNEMMITINEFIKCPLILCKKLEYLNDINKKLINKMKINNDRNEMNYSNNIENNDKSDIDISNLIVIDQICLSFIKNFLITEYSEPIKKIIIPSLSNLKEFPFKYMINSLCQYYFYKNLNNNHKNTNNINIKNYSNLHLNNFNDYLNTNDDYKMKIDTNNSDNYNDDNNKSERFKLYEKISMDLNSSFLLYAILNLDKEHFDKFHDKILLSGYIKIISLILPKIHILPRSSRYTKMNIDDNTDSEDDDDDDNEDHNGDNRNDKNIGITALEKECLLRSIELLNEPERVGIITDNIDLILDDPETLHSLCKICHDLMIFNKSAIYDYKLLYTFAFMPKFLRSVWFTLTSQSSQLGFSSPLSLLSKGVVPKADIDIDRTIPFLATFCALFGRLVPTLHDVEFCEGNNFIQSSLASTSTNISSTVTALTSIKSLMPFTLQEIVQLSKTLKEISLGLVELAFPETRSNINEHYRSVFGHNNDDLNYNKITKLIWSNLLKVVVSVLNQIHTRDLRRNFCPDGHWTIQTLNLPLDRPSDLPLTRGNRRGLRPFQPIRDFTREDFENGPPMSTKQIRSITILREIPFVVPFNTRVSILQGLIAADKILVQGDLQGFLQGPSIQITVRRSHLYEDAYDKLRPENEPDLRHKFRVQFINNLNLEEAGIDGGGLFREFLSELIKTAFDPNRGFFMVTTDNKLYPNPSVGYLIPDFEKHYYFMGRILGKAIYENLLVELPLAEFFLSKLAGKYSDVDVHQLASLDPILYRNLLSLKEYEGDVNDLGLDFTVVNNDLGTTKIQELKPNGQQIQVTSANRIEYIQLMADYKLNKQIRQHCIAFRKGLSNVLPVEWLYMFSNKELQILISGAEIPINLDDLKLHCRYGGEYNPTHPTIQCFWKVVEEFTDLQKRQLLKFVTSCSRPPLLGFKDLDPPFSIQNAGDEERLPTASTCTNLLKLPSFKTVEQMREKLLYAIQAGAGFDLS